MIYLQHFLEFFKVGLFCFGGAFGMIPLIEEKVAGLGGYIERSDVYNGSSYRTYRDLRWASLTIRIPKDKLDGFVQDMKGVSNVTNCNQSVKDVTLTYVDLESHKKAL